MNGDAEPSFVTSHTQPKTQMSVMPDDSVSNFVSVGGGRKEQGETGNIKGGATGVKETTTIREEDRPGHVTTHITQDKLASIRNRPSALVKHLEQTNKFRQPVTVPSVPMFSSGPLRPEHLKPLKPTLTVDRAPVRYSGVHGLRVGEVSSSGIGRSASIRTVAQSEQVTSFPARAPSTLQHIDPLFQIRIHNDKKN